MQRTPSLQALGVSLVLHFVFIFSLTVAAEAAVTPEEVSEHCRVQMTADGGEIATKVTVSGETWDAGWGYDIPGDTITVVFGDGDIVLREQSSKMADHIVTIAGRQAEEVDIFVARVHEGVLNALVLVLPLDPSLTGDEPACFYEWLTHN